MEARDYVVEVRDSELNRKGVIASKHLDLTISPVFNNVGEWTLTLPSDHPLTPTLRRPGAGIIVTGPSGTLMSGPVQNPSETMSVNSPAGDVTFVGVDDNVILADMRAWPQPANANVSTQNKGFDVRTGKAEAVMHAYVNANVGPGAPTGRRNPRLVMGDQGGGGSTITKQARFETLGELLASIAAPDGLGFRVVQQGSSLVFQTYQPEDRSRSVRLSIETGSLSSTTISLAAPTITRAIVGGMGEDIDRTMVEASTTDSLAAETNWGRRIEVFIDYSQSDFPDELRAAAAEALAAGGSAALSAKAVAGDDAAQSFGVDWSLGDTVGIMVGDAEYQTIASGAVIKIDSSGVLMGVVLGNDGDLSPQSSTVDRLLGVESRVSNLERIGTAERSQCGRTSVPMTAGSVVQTNIAFPRAFSVAPVMQVSLGGTGFPQLSGVTIAAVSASSFTVAVWRDASSSSGSLTLHWSASVPTT